MLSSVQLRRVCLLTFLLLTALYEPSAAVELMRTEQVRSGWPRHSSQSDDSSSTGSNSHYELHGGRSHRHGRGKGRGRGRGQEEADEEEDDEDDDDEDSTSETITSSTSSTTTTTTTDAWPSRRRRVYGFCEQGGEACWDDGGCLQSNGPGHGGHRNSSSKEPDHGPSGPGPAQQEDAEEEELAEVRQQHGRIKPHRYDDDDDNDEDDGSLDVADAAFGYSLIYLGGREVGDSQVGDSLDDDSDEPARGGTGRGDRPEDRATQSTDDDTSSAKDAGGGGLHWNPYGSSTTSKPSSRGNRGNRGSSGSQGNSHSKAGENDHHQTGGSSNHSHSDQHGHGNGHDHGEGKSGGGKGNHSHGGKDKDSEHHDGSKQGTHRAGKAMGGNQNHTKNSTGNGPNHCRQVYVEQLQGTLGERRKMVKKGRCYNDITRPCVSKYECDHGTHKCVWSDAELLGGKCATSKANCTGRWDCPLTGLLSLDPSANFDECEIPKLCEDDNLTICREDSECSDRKRCISRCKVEMAQLGLIPQCEEDRPCFWNDYKTGEHLLFDYRWRHGPNNTRQCLPACPETLDNVTRQVNVTCLTRPFGACYSAQSNLRCEYGRFYNGVDPTPGEACKCHPHHMPHNISWNSSTG